MQYLSFPFNIIAFIKAIKVAYKKKDADKLIKIVINSKNVYLNIYLINSFILAFYCLIKVNSCNKIKISKNNLYNNI
jgi:hypothetical protein